MSKLTECLGEVLVAVTEDRCRIILRFENGKTIAFGLLEFTDDSECHGGPYFTTGKGQCWASEVTHCRVAPHLDHARRRHRADQDSRR